MSAPKPITHAPHALWVAARAFIVGFINLFGAPEDIAAEHTLLKPARDLLLSWLRVGEALLRQLLLIEASVYPKPNTRPLLHETRQRERRAIGFEAHKPEDWRVSFRCFLSSSPACGGSAEQREAKGDVAQLAPSDAFGVSSPTRGGDKRHFYSAWPLAERAEAMLRVFNNPEPYARRLARRLHATPHRAAALTRHPDNLPHVIDDYVLLREHVSTARRRVESG